MEVVRGQNEGPSFSFRYHVALPSVLTLNGPKALSELEDVIHRGFVLLTDVFSYK